MQIQAARYSNPLTLLPGNVPIQEQIERLLQRHAPFVACHCDLDYFKPFNDRYGYGRGDDVIQMTGRILASVCTPELDFIGHIGGDDFVLLFQSTDWEARCHHALQQFRNEIHAFFSPEDLDRQGYVTEDRKGSLALHPLTSLSIGATLVEAGVICSHHDVSVWMSESKAQAKKQPGGGLFIDRRTHRSISPAAGSDRFDAAGLRVR
jgi:diguanylate cyclase (GGDEF)-like protein